MSLRRMMSRWPLYSFQESIDYYFGWVSLQPGSLMKGLFLHPFFPRSGGPVLLPPEDQITRDRDDEYQTLRHIVLLLVLIVSMFVVRDEMDCSGISSQGVLLEMRNCLSQ